ncbi:MAG TPA: hypothetical protein VE422_23615 [Terriglobia bacterium]|nr:hypothetical protein [Terriglobia bacterium]
MLSVARGICHSLFVYDIAFSIDLNETERRITSFTQRETIKHKRRAPRYFAYQPAPLRISQDAVRISISDKFDASTQVELVVYDFGAVSVIYRIPLGGESPNLLALSVALYENELLLKDSRRRVEDLLKLIESAVSKPNISSFVEDYLIFQIEAFAESITLKKIKTDHAQHVAQILRSEVVELSDDEVTDALSHQISYGKDDLAILDWNAALVIEKEAEDVLTVLEFANVELLEMRFLDYRLDDALAQAYERQSKRSRKWFPFRSDPSDLRDISQWQVDSAVLFEGVNNVLKLLGDQYLARLYRLAAQRFHLTDWDASIFRKLETLQSIYQKISDQIVSWRMEVLEWIIIVLIAISIVLPFFSGAAGH